MLTFRGHPVRSGDLFVVHEGEVCMSHVQLGCQIFLNLEEKKERDKSNKINLFFLFNSLQTHGEG